MPLKRIALRHAAPGAKGHDVESFEIPSNTESDDLETFAREILGRAQEDADGLGGMQRYMLYLYQEGEPKAIARFPFRTRAEEDEFDEISGDESPTYRGLVQQQMRHNEVIMKAAMTGMASMMTQMARRLEASDQHVAQLISQRQKDLEAVEEAKSQQHDRDMQLLLTEGTEKRKDAIVERLALLAPSVVNKLAGVKVLPGDDPGVILLKSLAGSLKPEQIEALMASLTMEQRIVFGQLLHQLQASGGINGQSDRKD